MLRDLVFDYESGSGEATEPVFRALCPAIKKFYRISTYKVLPSTEPYEAITLENFLLIEGWARYLMELESDLHRFPFSLLRARKF